MIRRPTWILLIIFAVLIVAAVLLQRNAESSASQEPTATPQATAASVYGSGPGTVSSVRIETKNGKTIEFTLQAGGWVVNQPEGSTLSSGELQQAISELESWKVLNHLDNQPPLDSVGLAAPAYLIEMTMNSGTTQTVQVGDETPTGSGYYVRVGNGNTVVVNKNSVDPVLNLLNDEPAETPSAPPSSTPPAATTPTSP